MLSVPQDLTKPDEAEWRALLARTPGPREDTPFHRLYAPIAFAPTLVIAQLGQSLDGRIATETGHSHYINGPESLVHLHRLRALVDAVIVGVGTVIADNPSLTVRRVEGPNPTRIVIDPARRIPRNAALLNDAAAPTILIHATQAAGGIQLPAPNGRIDPQAIIAALAAKGLRRLLIEGGARTVSSFLAAGALDRLHICVAPLLIGSGLPGITLPPIPRLDQAIRPPAALYAIGNDALFDLNLR